MSCTHPHCNCVDTNGTPCPIYHNGHSLISNPKTSSVPLYIQMCGRAARSGNKNVLELLRIANPERCKAFGHTVENMTIEFWGIAVAGETGELCNFIKKMARSDDKDFIPDIAKEAADIVIYLDLLCAKLGIDLQASIINKFNEVSIRVNSPITI